MEIILSVIFLIITILSTVLILKPFIDKNEK